MGQKVAFFAAGIAVVVLLYYQLYYSSLSDELDNLKNQNTQLTQQNKQLQDRERKYKELVKKNDDLKEQLIKNRISLPTSAELPAFFVHLQKQAASSGVSINRWSRRREIPIGKSYVKVPVGMTITGTYYQILHYFKLLSETDRIITVESLSLGGAKVRADETVLRASFTASTFRLPGDGSDDLFQGEPEDEAADKPAGSLKDRAKQKVEAARDKREQDVAERSGETIEGSGGDEGKPSGSGDAQQDGVNRITGGGGTTP
jgi:Tfp pilus assembly protein PilO